MNSFAQDREYCVTYIHKNVIKCLFFDKIIDLGEAAYVIENFTEEQFSAILV
ncbi:hypothetical protein [Olivibacter sp. XZL3]|uniref:hypothetical protein n=1 Tax=Olivibacter sp. XZL3 TaxID=1735116 RepID=UPI001416FF79|nr:hypothetical protein [Olivibacter sp. XZL3]